MLCRCFVAVNGALGHLFADKTHSQHSWNSIKYWRDHHWQLSLFILMCDPSLLSRRASIRNLRQLRNSHSTWLSAEIGRHSSRFQIFEHTKRTGRGARQQKVPGLQVAAKMQQTSARRNEELPVNSLEIVFSSILTFSHRQNSRLR